MSRYTKLKFNDPTLNIPGMIIKFLPSGKVIFKVDGETSHFTLHPGRRSGIIDIHKTDELAHDGETSKYETIGKISQDELITRLSVMGPKFLLVLEFDTSDSIGLDDPQKTLHWRCFPARFDIKRD